MLFVDTISSLVDKKKYFPKRSNLFSNIPQSKKQNSKKPLLVAILKPSIFYFQNTPKHCLTRHLSGKNTLFSNKNARLFRSTKQPQKNSSHQEISRIFLKSSKKPIRIVFHFILPTISNDVTILPSTITTIFSGKNARTIFQILFYSPIPMSQKPTKSACRTNKTCQSKYFRFKK